MFTISHQNGCRNGMAAAASWRHPSHLFTTINFYVTAVLNPDHSAGLCMYIHTHTHTHIYI